MKHSLFPILVLGMSATAHAQGAKAIPEAASMADMNAAHMYPLGVVAGRTQQIVDGSAITDQRAAILLAIEYRRDTTTNGAFEARTIGDLRVSVSHTAASPAKMSSIFARNRTETATIVHTGSYNLPAQPVVQGVAPWNIQIKFSRPFVYERSKGHLLIETEIPGKSARPKPYVLDAIQESPGGDYRTFGANGSLASVGTRYSFTGAGSTLRPGGSAQLTVNRLTKAYPALAIYGLSNKSWGAISLPLDLGVLGAPKNHLYVSMDLAVPLVLRPQWGGTFGGSVSLPIPASVETATIYGQGLFVDPASNKLGLVLSNGVELRIVPGVTSPSQAVATDAPNEIAGWFMFGSVGRGGPVIRLRGGF